MSEKQEASSSMALEQPLKEYWKFLVDLIFRFYEAESSMALEMKYIRYGKESMSKFKMEMKIEDDGHSSQIPMDGWDF